MNMGKCKPTPIITMIEPNRKAAPLRLSSNMKRLLEIIRTLAPHQLHDAGADAAVILLQWPQNAVPVFRQMRQRMAIFAKDVMVEQRFPGAALGQRALGDGDHGEQHGGVRRIRAAGKGVPPVIDQPVEWRKRLDAVPPRSE